MCFSPFPGNHPDHDVTNGVISRKKRQRVFVKAAAEHTRSSTTIIRHNKSLGSFQKVLGDLSFLSISLKVVRQLVYLWLVM